MLKITLLKIILSLVAAGLPLLCHGQSQQQAPIVFSLMTIPVYIEENRTGPLYTAHQKIVDALSQRLNLTLTTTITPPLRAEQNFLSNQAQALMPDFCDSHLAAPNLHSVPFARIIRYIMTPPNSPTINSYADLKGKKVGLVRGYRYEIEGVADSGIELLWTISQRQTVRMLKHGHLDAIIANLDVVSEIVHSEGGEIPSVDIHHPVTNRSLCYLFRDNALGRLLALEVSAEIIELRRQGKLAQYVGKNHIPEFSPGTPEVR